jgi:hypothetical protein
MNVDLVKKIVSLFVEGFDVRVMPSKLGISRTYFYSHLKILKDNGVVERVGYGVWQLNQTRWEDFSSKLELPDAVALKSESSSDQFPVGVKRAHALQFTMPYPFSFPTRKQEALLKRQDVKYEGIGIDGLWVGFSFVLGDWIVKMYPTTMSCTLRKGVSFYSTDAYEASFVGIHDFLKAVVKKLEVWSGKSWKKGKLYRFKTSRQHIALIKDALAKNYRLQKKKLFVRSPAGTLWLLADFSFSEDELEGVDGRKAPGDAEVVETFMNSVKSTGTTMQDVLNMFAKNQEQMSFYAENMVSHVKAVQKLGAGVEELTGVVKNIKGESRLSEEVTELQDLMMVVESIDDLEKHEEFISSLSESDKAYLTEWINEKFGVHK